MDRSAAPIGAAAPQGLPTFFEITAPAHWRAIDFISDLHLCAPMPRTFDAFASHLRHTQAGAVFILGDLFELWVGDDMRQRPFEQACVEVLAEAASRLHVAFMVGNRDFLLGTAMLRDCGMMALPDPTVLGAWGQRVLLSHGDALCLSDLPYQAFRREVRSPAWQQAFLSKPLPERLALAAQMRSASAQRQPFDGDAEIDVDAGEAVRWMHTLGAAEMVHGHTHRPGSNSLAPGFKRHVLSDWDLDLDLDLDQGPDQGLSQGQRAEVLRLSRDGFERRAPATAARPG